MAFLLSLVLLLGLLAYIFYQGGGNIQKIVTSKTNVQDIRSAAFINVIYGIILLIFKEANNLPMSTTWVFIGLLAGRELAMTYRLRHREMSGMWRILLLDLGKTVAGLLVSVVLVVAIRLLT
jgi:phosphate/sulfate permease